MQKFTILFIGLVTGLALTCSLAAEKTLLPNTENLCVIPAHQKLTPSPAHPVHRRKISPTENHIKKNHIKNWEKQFTAWFRSLSPKQQSALEKKLTAEKEIALSKQGLIFYEPTYLLPFYYTGRPYQSVYENNTPNNQRILNTEWKGQLSFQFPIWTNMFGTPLALNVSYTQLSYWQFYAKSQFFRETDYEPQLFLSDHFAPNWLAAIGINHESNGRGGDLERSWNRLFFDMTFSGTYWLIDFKPWVLIFPQESSSLHNPDIAHYLGYERLVLAVKFHDQEISLVTGNTFESGFKRGSIQLDYNFPIHGMLRGDVQCFSGYGQSLIEYNHYTNSCGVGLSLSDWL